MDRKKDNPSKGDAALIREAAKITGKPETELTVQDAENVLFGEIGVTVPKSPRKQAWRILQNEVIKQMAENPLDQQQKKQEAQEATPERFDPETAGEIIGQTAATLIEAGDYGTAAGLVAEAAKEMTPQQALEILENGSDNPEIQEALEEIADRAVETHIYGLTREEWEPYRQRLQAAQDAGGEPARLEEAQRIGEELSAQLHAAADAASQQEAPAEPGNEQEYKPPYSVVIPLAAKNVQEATVAAQAALYEILASVSKLVKSDTFRAIQREVAEITNYIEAHREEIAAIAETSKAIAELAPFVQIEIEALKESSDWPYIVQNLEGKPLEALIEDGIDADGNPIPGPLATVIERAKQRKADYEAAAETVEAVEKAQEEIPRIISNPTDLLSYPLDKPNLKIWGMLESTEKNGQLAFDILTSKKGSKQDALIYYAISFAEQDKDIKITKTLTPFDKRVYIAAAALYNAGNSVMTATQIHKMMGNRGQPKADQIAKINDSLTKMGAAHITIDNTQEAQVNKSYPRFKYDATLLPFERLSAYINNTLTESAIRLFREPPLITFARERGQITGITRQLLESPISKTDANLQLEDYLLDRIGHMKNPKSKAPRKMLLATIYDRCNIRTRNQRSRAPEKIRKYLDHYKTQGFIAGYTMTADSVTIHL